MRKYLALFGVLCAFAIPAAAIAAELDETKFTGLIALGAACEDGADGAWYHFINNQTGGATGTLTVDFSDPAEDRSGITPFAVNNNVLHFYVFGESTLIDARTPGVPGNLVLSHISCGKKTDDPTTLPEVEA
jgi:hypothetical protein